MNMDLGRIFLQTLWFVALYWCIKGLVREIMFYQEYRAIIKTMKDVRNLKCIGDEDKERLVGELNYMLEHIKDCRKFSEEEYREYKERCLATLSEIKEALIKDTNES